MCTSSKIELRRIIKEKLDKMPQFDKILKSELIVDDIIASGIINQYASVLLYKSLPNEVNVDRLIDWAVSHGKRVYLPRVNGDKLEIVQYPCKLVKGAFGVLEPLGQAVDICPKLVITPLLAVDKLGNRLGKGKGYYDKYFESAGECMRVGVAFREQMVDDVFAEAHDIQMSKIFVR